MDNSTPTKNDLKAHADSIALSRIRRRVLANILLLRITLLTGICIAVFILVIFFGRIFSQPIDNFLFWPKMGLAFLIGNSGSLDNREGRTNILILGVGGAGHEAPELTDTIMLISFGQKDKNPVFLSLPRDIWIPTLRAKVNTAYYYGNQKREGGGLVLAKASVSEIFDQPIHYALAIDFAGFVELVDTLGGVGVDVERAFEDPRYPIPGRENDKCNGEEKNGAKDEFPCRYENLRFEEGRQNMDGKTALKFVRSRNAEGVEGTDFARSSRQQKVIQAIKQKLLSFGVLFNPPKISRVLRVVENSVETDIPQDKLPIVFRMLATTPKDKIKNVVLDGGAPGDSQTGFLVNPPKSARYDNQWVLIPRDETWQEVRSWLVNILK